MSSVLRCSSADAKDARTFVIDLERRVLDVEPLFEHLL